MKGDLDIEKGGEGEATSGALQFDAFRLPPATAKGVS